MDSTTLADPISEGQRISSEGHTPTPWELDDDGPTVYLYAKMSKDNWLRANVAYTTDFSWDAPHLANAAFIVKAVNSHDALVEALHEARMALFKIRACSIVGCEQGYGKPELWADALFASHGDVAKALKTIDAALQNLSAASVNSDQRES